MALFSYILLALGTVTACLSAARVPIMTGTLVVSSVVMAAAVLLMRWTYKAKLAREVRDESGAAFDFSAAVGNVQEVLGRLEQDQQAGCSEIHAELDKLVDGPLFDFAEARHNLLALHGFGEFARIVGEFSRGERAVNRAWSAAVDGYLNEARDYVSHARDIFAGLTGEIDNLSEQSSRP